jgi:DNA modification methylase
VEQVIGNPQNTNKHPDKQVALLAKIIDYQGWRHPIVVSNLSGYIVAGHGRLDAAKKLGADTVPVSYQDFENKAQEMAFLEADNLVADLAEHDQVMMLDNIRALDLDDDFDLELFGMPDLQLPEVKVLNEESEDEVPENVETRCKEGDLWILGEHRLLCGDSTNIQHVERLMGGQKAQTFFTDPPYGDNVGGLKPKTGKDKKKAIAENRGLVDRETFIENDKDIDWLKDVFNLVPSFLENVSTKMVFFKWDKYQKIKDCAASFGDPSACCVWDRVRKSSAFFRFQPQHEFCFHWGSQADKKEKSSLSNVWRIEKELENNSLHPTVKPIALIEPVIKVTTDRASGVLDLFGGSGSTLIACEKTNRKCFMMELDPHYCDVILTRWEKYTGKQAERVV